MLIFNNLGDQVPLLVWSALEKGIFSLADPNLSGYEPYQRLFYGLFHPWLMTQPILWTFVSIFLRTFGTNSYNYLLLLTTLLNLYFSFRFFKKFRFGYAFALLYSFSAFYLSHFSRHIDLMQIWIVPFVMYEFFRKEKTLRQNLIEGLYLGISFLISNYIGFALFMFYAVYFSVNILLRLLKKKDLETVEVIYNSRTIVSGMIVVFLGLLPLIVASNYNNSPSYNPIPQNRTYEDFFYFSSRPWYFFTPSPKNPVLGNLGKSLLTTMEQTGNFLTDDYFVYEHSSNYYGITFYIGVVLLLTLYYKDLSPDNKRKLTVLSLSVIIIVLFTMPPYFTISGLKIYTPGELLYRIAPLFRVTSRFLLIVHFLLLYMVALLSENIRDKRLYKLVGIFTILIFLETLVPVRVDIYRDSPAMFKYLRERAHGTNTLFLTENINEVLYWLPVHRTRMVNLTLTDDLNVSLLKHSTLIELVETNNVEYIVSYNQIDITSSLEVEETIGVGEYQFIKLTP